MFGVVIPGRKCQTNFQKISNSKFVTALDNSSKFTQMMVFKLPGTPAFPNNFGASIFLADMSKKFMYLGHLSNEKESSLIQVPTNFEGVTTNTLFGDSQKQGNQTLYMGINLEKMEVIKNLENKNTETTNQYTSSIQDLGTHIGYSLTNYVSSFSKYVPQVGKEMIIMDLTSINKWFAKFNRKLKMDPWFWKNKKKGA